MRCERKCVVLMANRACGHLSGRPTFDFRFREFVVAHREEKREMGVAELDSVLSSSPTKRTWDDKELAV